ncbi:hypothetical protein JTB14_024023 [Gonioctena quinquepunctata]|nr:hypothetical protein JTB14_024023 [Gonioctena quinquepunctata]
MDELNLCESFNGLLEENNEGWIITKNEKGKVKIATCQEDESNIYEKSRDWIIMSAEQTRTDTLKLPKSEFYKYPEFFIRDLLNAEKKDGYFLFRNIPYVNVFICGTVVSLYIRNDKYHIIVDDGTSSIKCIISKEDLTKLKGKVESTDVSIDKKSTSVLLKAAAMVLTSIKFLEKSIPDFSDLEMGDIVKIMGPVTEYEGNRYIFIKRITKEPKGTISHCVHLENILRLYTEVY